MSAMTNSPSEESGATPRHGGRRAWARDADGKRILARGRIDLAPQDKRLLTHLMKQSIAPLAAIPNQRHHERSASHGTKQGHREHLNRFLRWLLARGYHPPGVANLKPHYVSEYLAFLAEPRNAYSVAYQRNVFTTLRLFYEVGLRKTQCLGDFQDYFGSDAVRSTATAVDLSVSGQVDGHGVPLVAEQLIEQAAAHPTKHARRVAAILALCLTLGVRVSEALCLRPILELERLERDDVIDIRRKGSKGGRARTVFFLPGAEDHLRAAAVAALKQAATFCRAADDTVFPTRNQTAALRRARERVYNTLRVVGVDTRNLGVSPHAFRHEFVKRCWLAGGHRRPLDGPLPNADRSPAGLATLLVWRLLQIERLGHTKLEKTDAYTGRASGQLHEAGVARREHAEAKLLHADIPPGNVYGLLRRFYELQALPYEVVRAQVVRNLENKYITPLDLPAEFRIPAALAYSER